MNDTSNKLFGDIDIDVADREQILNLIDHTRASLFQLEKSKDEWEIRPHNSGIYIQKIPVDPLTGLSSLEYQNAENFGYYKIDLLNMHLYSDIDSEQQINDYINTPLDWKYFEDSSFVSNLYHLHNHSDLVTKLKPKSIPDLAAVLAIIRPGKRHLENKSWEIINREVWKKNNDGKYTFKKSHAISYAMAIYVQTQMIINN